MAKITEEEKYGLLFKVLLFTGIREGEAIGLTWDSVNFQTGVISINKQLQKRPKQDRDFVFAPLKNDKVRSIAPAPFVMALLRQRRNEETRQRLLAGAAWEGWHSDRQRETAPVFTNAFGAHLHPQTVYNHFKKLVVPIGAPQARVHDLRTPSPSSPSKTVMTSNLFKAIWDTPPPLSRWMSTVMFPRK